VANASNAIARAYAGALLRVGEDQRCLGRIHEDLHAFMELLHTATEFRAFFRSPRIDRFAKWKVMEKALRGQVCDPVLGLIRTLMLRGRGPQFDNVVAAFDVYRDQSENRLHAEVTTAAPLNPALRESLRARLAKSSGKTVDFEEHVVPAVLGGVVLRVGDRRIDRTVRRRLEALRQRLESTNTESNQR
jgi:F-type H+-transporting ATPase subunit delta